MHSSIARAQSKRKLKSQEVINFILAWHDDVKPEKTKMTLLNLIMIGLSEQ